MRRRWFVPVGWFHRPLSWQGHAIDGVTIVFCIHAFVAIDRHSHSVSDTLWGLFPFVVPAFLLLDWIASRSSDGS